MPTPPVTDETVLVLAHPEVGAASSTLPLRGPNRRRVGVLTCVGIALALIGAAALGLAGLQRSEGGFFTTGAQTLSTSTSALVTDEVLLEQRRPGNSSSDLGDLAQVRVRAGAPANSTAIFVGIGPTADVDAYLRAASHDRMASFETDPFVVHYARTPGRSAPPPAAQPFWVATASGAGPQTLLWDKRQGAWSAVAMNADGTPGVTVTSDIGLRFGFLFPTGLALLIAGGSLLAAGLRRRRSAPAAVGPIGSRGRRPGRRRRSAERGRGPSAGSASRSTSTPAAPPRRRT